MLVFGTYLGQCDRFFSADGCMLPISSQLKGLILVFWSIEETCFEYISFYIRGDKYQGKALTVSFWPVLLFFFCVSYVLSAVILRVKLVVEKYLLIVEVKLKLIYFCFMPKIFKFQKEKDK